MTTRTWGGLILESRAEFGKAARRNRGNYSGEKVHRLWAEYIVGLVAGEVPRRGTLGARFEKTGKPVLFSSWPRCGATQGQHAGAPFPELTAADVTCERCKKKFGDQP
jgi:hypothetical protein